MTTCAIAERMSHMRVYHFPAFWESIPEFLQNSFIFACIFISNMANRIESAVRVLEIVIDGEFYLKQ